MKSVKGIFGGEMVVPTLFLVGLLECQITMETKTVYIYGATIYGTMLHAPIVIASSASSMKVKYALNS